MSENGTIQGSDNPALTLSKSDLYGHDVVSAENTENGYANGQSNGAAGISNLEIGEKDAGDAHRIMRDFYSV